MRKFINIVEDTGEPRLVEGPWIAHQDIEREMRLVEAAEPSLTPAIRVGKKIYRAGPGETHSAIVWNQLSAEERQAMETQELNPFVFVDHRGHVLERDRAVDYALDNDLILPRYRDMLERGRGHNGLAADFLKGRGYDRIDETPECYIGILEKTLREDVWHGSPHDFSEFSTQHIGRGEGVQAYGWGLYFTGSKGIAEFYRDSLTKTPEIDLLGQPVRTYLTKSPGVQSHIDTLRDEVARRANLPDLEASDVVFALRQIILYVDLDGKTVEESLRHVLGVAHLALMDSEKANDGRGSHVLGMCLKIAPVIASLLNHKNPGRLYHVTIPEEDTYLFWDAVLDRQTPKVKQALQEIELLRPYLQPQMKGVSIYRELGSLLRGMAAERFQAAQETDPNYAELKATWRELKNNPDKAASLELLRYGIHGIKYLDGASRDGDDDRETYNYVLFDGALAHMKG